MEMVDPEQIRTGPELLVLRALKLGDLLVAVPAISALRRGLPDHRLILAVPGWLEPIVALVDGVDALLPTPGLDEPLPLRPGRIDTAVNMHGSGPESALRIRELAARRTLGHDGDGPPWRDGMLERERWARLVNHFGFDASAEDVAINVPAQQPIAAGMAIVHVGAFYGSRQWPVDRFTSVARAFTESGLRVGISGGETDRVRAEAVARGAGLGADSVLAGRLDLAEFAAVVAAAQLVVTADTGAAHLASAYGIPSIVLFGPAPPQEWGPPRSGPHIVLTDASLRVGDTFGAEPDPALLAVTVNDVLDAAGELGFRIDLSKTR